MEPDSHHGKEIYLFFGIYGINGILGIIVASTLIGVIIYKVFQSIKKGESYEAFLHQIYKNEKSRDIIKIIVNIFLLISFYIMVAGFSAYFSQELKIPNIVGTIVILILCYVIFMGNIERVIKVNTFLIPILILFIITLISQNLNVYTNVNHHLSNSNIGESIYHAVLYSSYNSILLIPMLISLKKYVKDKKQAIWIAILCTIILAILAIAIFGLLLKIDSNVNMLELPTVYVAGRIGKIYQYIYGFIILVSIYTSAISAGFGVLENHINNPKKYKHIAIAMCISAIFVSQLGFSNLINSLYPIFGLLGTIQIALIMKNKT